MHCASDHGFKRPLNRASPLTLSRLVPWILIASFTGPLTILLTVDRISDRNSDRASVSIGDIVVDLAFDILVGRVLTLIIFYVERASDRIFWVCVRMAFCESVAGELAMCCCPPAVASNAS